MQKENVKTLPMAVFDKIDKLGSPRLVEYWEQDPCTASDPKRKLVVITEKEIRYMVIQRHA